jgi:hypothetical protein
MILFYDVLVHIGLIIITNTIQGSMIYETVEDVKY